MDQVGGESDDVRAQMIDFEFLLLVLYSVLRNVYDHLAQNPEEVEVVVLIDNQSLQIHIVSSHESNVGQQLDD